MATLAMMEAKRIQARGKLKTGLSQPRMLSGLRFPSRQGAHAYSHRRKKNIKDIGRSFESSGDIKLFYGMANLSVAVG
jgi:hypothetical protein